MKKDFVVELMIRRDEFGVVFIFEWFRFIYDLRASDAAFFFDQAYILIKLEPGCDVVCDIIVESGIVEERIVLEIQVLNKI